ncbi:U-box domain-containing protein 44-like [Phalaenopsis equestris]|uniref:U-box domain-containing protein 44-like n=1 Tax=Phalaenopsis equestris TaxID=78828 RepID=UPI0009E1CEB3|nr:U-box domain-containing protein 44-like [Phalaenopsis equestris]
MEILTNGRDEALKGVLDHLSTLIAAADSIKQEDDNFRRYADYMIHVQELLVKLQSQQATIELARLLRRIETEVYLAREIIDGYKSKPRLFRSFICRSVVWKLNQSSKEIYAVLQLLPFAQINTALNIKETADAIIQGVESLQLKLSTNYNAVLSSLDSHISENSGNQQQTSHGLFMISRSKGTASSSVCPLPIQIEAREPEGERSDVDSYLQLPPSSFFLCPLTGEILVDPVSVFCNHSFERKAIEEYFDAGQNLCPLCNKELSSTGKLEITSNSTLRNSILEWKKREEQINAERNAKKKLIEAATKISLDDMENTNQALGDLHALMIEIPSCVSAATESSCKLISKLAELLKNNSVENISTVLKCLLLISCFSDENKEIIGRSGVIKCLLKQSMMDPATDPTALALLLDLSRNKSAAGKIVGIPISISIFISFLDHPSSTVAEMARTVLQNLSIDINSTVTMAKSGYFTPFLEHFNSQEISDEIRAQMAERLSQIQLTETSAKNLQNERFMTHLTESLSCNFPPTKIASLNCIKHLIAFHELKTSFLQNESAITALLSLITTKSTDDETKQKAVEILISLIQTTQPSHPSFRPLFSSDGIRELLHQIRTSAPEDQIWLLRLLAAMAQNSAAVGEFIVSDHGALSFLFSAIGLEQNRDLKMIALKLIYYIAGKHHIVIPLPSSPSKESIIHSLITILSDRRVAPRPPWQPLRPASSPIFRLMIEA